MDNQLQYLLDLDKTLADNAPVASTPESLGGPLNVTRDVPRLPADAVAGPGYDQTPPEPDEPEAEHNPAEEAAEPNYDKTPPVPDATPKADAIQAPVVAQTQGNQSKLVGTAPKWYNDLAPPNTGVLQAFGGLAAGLLPLIAVSNGRGTPRARREASVQRRDILAKGLGNFVGQMTQAPQQDYQTRLAAAGKQADMTAKLNGSGGDALGWERLRLAQQKRLDAITNAEEKAKAKAELDDPNSARSKMLWSAAVQGGVFKPTDKPLSGTQLIFIKPQAGQAASQERGLDNTKTMHNIRTDTQVELKGLDNQEHDRRFEQEQEAKLGSEEREQQKLDEQAYIPGFKYVGKRAPNIASVEKARVISDNSQVAYTSAKRLGELWRELSNKARLSPAWLEGALSDEDRSKVNKMRAWALNLDTAQRQLALMGVPQQFEMEIIRNVSPDATGIRAFLNDGTAWDAQADVLQDLSGTRMRNYGYAPEGSPEAEAAHETKPQAKPSRTLTQKVTAAGEATRPLVNEAVDAGKAMVGGAVKTAGQVAAGAVAPVGNLLKIEVFDPVKKIWKYREVTQDQYRAGMKGLADKKLPLDYIRKAK